MEKRTNMDFSELEQTIESLHDYAGGDHDEISLSPQSAEKAALYLEWLSEFLENRRLYHKKQNTKKNLAVKAMKKLLSRDELVELDREADRLIGNVHNPDELD